MVASARSSLGGGAVATSVAAPLRTTVSAWLQERRRDWVGTAVAGVAGVFWLLGHIPGALASIAMPEWVLFGIATGVLRPSLGLVLTVALVPFLGGAVDQPVGEALRVVPIYGAAARLLIDRVRGRGLASAPPGWVTVAAIVAGLLYIGTFVTFLMTIRGVIGDLPYAGWLVGGPAAGMAAWIVASHVEPRRQGALAEVLFFSTAIAVTVGLAAWTGVGLVSDFVFPTEVRGRLAAFGFPTPTGMGLAVALPFAFAGAWRRARPAAVVVAVAVLFTIVLTESRGPLVAVGAAAFVAIVAKPRPPGRLVAAFAGAGLLVAAAFVVVSFGTSPAAILQGIADKAGGDSARIASWRAGLAMLLSSPLVGGGWHALAQFGDQAGLGTGTVQSHNLFLHAFSEGGLPLGLTFGAVTVYSAVAAWRNRHAHGIWVLAAVAVYLVCGIWDFPQVRSYAAVMGGIALGLAAVRVP